MNNSKINQKQIIICVFAILLLLIFCTILISLPHNKVCADIINIDDTQVIGHGMGLYEIQDDILYEKILDECKKLDVSATEITAGALKNIIKLDLSAKSQTDKISTLNGLYYMKLTSLTSLDLSNNNITYLGDNLSYITNLKTLDLSNNTIKEFDGKFSNKLEYIDLSNNEIIKCDISTCVENSIIDLSFNKISLFSNITFPTVASDVSLTHNLLIEDAPTDTYSTLHLGFQGVKNNGEITEEIVIKFYGLDNVENIKIYKKNSDETYTLLGTYISSEISSETIPTLSINYYKIEFTETITPKVYSDIIFACRPDLPETELWQDGKKLEKMVYSVSNIVTLKFVGSGNIYYKLNNGEKQLATDYKIDKSGAYTFTYWQERDGLESVHNTFAIISSYVDPMTFVWIVLGIIGFIALFYIGFMYKNYLGNKKSSDKPTKSKGFN